MNFWILKTRDRFTRTIKGTCSFDVVDEMNQTDISLVCPECKQKIALYSMVPPINVRLSKAKYGDLVLGPIFDILVSDSFKQVYDAAGLTGLLGFHSIDKLTVKGRSKRHEAPPTYYAVRPKRNFVHLDEEASGIIWENPPTCDYCRDSNRRGIERVVIDESTWDGSDIFSSICLFGVIVVSERFVEVVEKNGLTNFMFVPADEYSEER